MTLHLWQFLLAELWFLPEMRTCSVFARSWPPSTMIVFSPWPVSVVYSFNFINLVMRGRCQVLLYTHKFQAKAGNSISKSSLLVTSCMTEFIWLQLHGGICYFTKNSAQHCRWGVEKVNEELKRKINKYY